MLILQNAVSVHIKKDLIPHKPHSASVCDVNPVLSTLGEGSQFCALSKFCWRQSAYFKRIVPYQLTVSAVASDVLWSAISECHRE